MAGRCPVCSAITPSGPNCEVEDGDCLRWTGTGTAASPFLLTPDLSVASGQILTCESTGMQALIPTSLTRPPTSMVYRGRYQSIPNNTLTAVEFIAELWDTDSMHSVSVNNTRVTFTTAGVYIVNVRLVWRDDPTGDRYAQIRKNGSSVLAKDARLSGGTGFGIGHNLTIQEDFSAADYVEVQVQQNSGAASHILDESRTPFLSATRVA